MIVFFCRTDRDLGCSCLIVTVEENAGGAEQKLPTPGRALDGRQQHVKLLGVGPPVQMVEEGRRRSLYWRHRSEWRVMQLPSVASEGVAGVASCSRPR